MKILLTGASGFIGGHILNKLLSIYDIESVVVLTSKEIEGVNCILYKGIDDFGLNANVFDDVTHIIHAGAFTPKDANQANDLDLCFGNIKYTKELFSYDYKALTKIINLSSVDVYALCSGPLSEKSVVEPISLYGASKLYCEEMAKAFSNYKNISKINLRIGHVYGPGEEKYKKVLPVAIQNILENKPLELWGSGEDLRSFIFIDDVVSSIINAIEYSTESIDVNVVSGFSISIKDLLSAVVQVSGKPIKIDRKESNHIKRDLVFDNALLMNTLLKKEKDFMEGLKVEYDYMKNKYENSV